MGKKPRILMSNQTRWVDPPKPDFVIVDKGIQQTFVFQRVIFSSLIPSSMPSENPDQTVVAPFSNRNWTYWNPLSLSLLKFVAILPVQLFSRKFLLKVLLENLQRILNFLLAAISPLSIFQNSSWFYNLVFCTNVLL